MTTTPYSAFGVGAEVEPLVSPGTNTLLQDADPALFFALDYFTYLINTFPGPRLLAAASAIGGVSITKAVAQAYPWAPQPQFAANQFAFPLLACYRTRTLTGRFTAAWEHDRGLIEVVYALPPLTSAQEEQLTPILKAIGST